MAEIKKMRAWQKKADKIIDETIGLNSVVVPIDACVGSGKTAVACNAFGKFIEANKDGKTVQLLVTPRIRLCDQQSKEITGFLNGAFGLENGKDYSLIPVDCTKDDFNKKNPVFAAKHAIFVICAESLFGADASLPGKPSRWNAWWNRFSSWRSAGFKFGYAAFDEAHNYEAQRDMVMGPEKSALRLFNVMLLSGTPSAMQRELSEKFKVYRCSCPFKMAVDNQWIVKPTMNLVLGGADAWARAIVAVLNREIRICSPEPFAPRIMVNCSSIDDIKRLNELPYFIGRAGKDFHFISLHSLKAYEDDNMQKAVEPMIDFKPVSALEAYTAIEKIDAGTAFPDDLPIIVAQVQMLSEGINVTSFNACLTASNNEKTAMQQIGRIVRNSWRGNASKVQAGHANVYILLDNMQAMISMLQNLAEYDLTDECFSWGDRIDVSDGSGVEADPDGIALLHAPDWEPIDPDHDIDIIQVMSKFNGKMYQHAARSMFAEWLDGDVDGNGKNDAEELEELLNSLNASGQLSFVYAGKPYSPEAAKEARIKAQDAVKKAKEVGETPAAGLEKAKKEVKLPVTFEIFIGWMFAIRSAMSNKLNRELWKTNRITVLDGLFGVPAVSEFLATHMTKQMEARIFK